MVSQWARSSKPVSTHLGQLSQLLSNTKRQNVGSDQGWRWAQALRGEVPNPPKSLRGTRVDSAERSLSRDCSSHATLSELRFPGQDTEQTPGPSHKQQD